MFSMKGEEVMNTKVKGEKMESLKFATAEEKNNEGSVREHIKELGAKEFQFASKRLRGDAAFIISLVGEYPEVLSHADSEIRERGVDRVGKPIDLPAEDNVIFAIECMSKNEESFKYLNQDLALKYYQTVEDGYMIKGHFLGSYIRWIGCGEKTQEMLSTLESLRPEIKDIIENSKNV